jgi:mercuric ion transport protein
MKKDNTLIGAGLLSSFTASLCCITPVFALVAGTSGIASTFAWLEPARPYFITFTVLALGFAWYQILKPKKEADCYCETPAKPKLIETKTFLSILTAFAMLMLVFPSYSHIFYPKTGSETELVDNVNLQTVEFSINGMTCVSCEEHVNHEVNKLSGIISSTTSYDKGNAVIQFDSLKTNVSEIETAIKRTGYEVTDRKEK